MVSCYKHTCSNSYHVPQESDEIEPQHFLDSMEPHLGHGGCIKSADEVAAIVQYVRQHVHSIKHVVTLTYRAMKNARLMVNKCLLLNIIKATKTDSTLERWCGGH